jgi:hypothetical protein
VTVVFDGLSFAEKKKLLQNAKEVVTQTGANCVNLFLCEKLEKLTLLTNDIFLMGEYFAALWTNVHGRSVSYRELSFKSIDRRLLTGPRGSPNGEDNGNFHVCLLHLVPDDLTILAEKYGSDKCPSILHTYTPCYHSFFKDIRTTTKSVLEIGIGHFEMMSEIVGESYKPGASLRMWREYFPNANIYSCDIVEKVIFQDDRIYTWVADQCKPASLENLVKNIQEMGTETIDIIVDDGSHMVSHQIISFITLWKYLSPGGLYIIEDVFHSHINLLTPICHSFTDVADVGHHAGPVDTDGFVFFRKK